MMVMMMMMMMMFPQLLLVQMFCHVPLHELNRRKILTFISRGSYNLHGKTGNSSWKIKWFASFCLERFANYGL